MNKFFFVLALAILLGGMWYNNRNIAQSGQRDLALASTVVMPGIKPVTHYHAIKTKTEGVILQAWAVNQPSKNLDGQKVSITPANGPSFTSTLSHAKTPAELKNSSPDEETKRILLDPTNLAPCTAGCEYVEGESNSHFKYYVSTATLVAGEKYIVTKK